MNALLKPSIHWLFIFIPLSVLMEHLDDAIIAMMFYFIPEAQPAVP